MIIPSTPRQSTAHITIPPISPVAAAPQQATPPLSDEAYAAFKSDVEAMLVACSDANLNEQLVNVITACIGEGINTAGWIIAMATSVGFKPRHAGSILVNSARGKSKTPLWRRDREGRYSLLD